jgi:Domain of unknown function (DUF4349)/Putative zinc-finger
MGVKTHPVSDEELMAYLDGELAAAQALEIAGHLADCASCRALASEFESLGGRLREWSVEPAPDELFQKLVPALQSQPRASRKGFTGFGRWTLLASGGTALLVLMVLASKIPSGLKMTRSMNIQRLPGGGSEPQAADAQLPAGPKIVRGAELYFTAKNFDTARLDIERVARTYGGHLAQLSVNSPAGQARSLSASLRVPSRRLDEALAELRKLGRVTNESQSGEEVSQRYVDIEARLANARNTEQRLTQLLRERTGKLPDVLAVEEQLDRVRGQIEVTEAEQKNLTNQIALATIQIHANEEYRPPFAAQDSSALNSLRTAGVEGVRNVASSVLAIALWLLETGPSLLLVAAALFFPARWLWRRSRPI